MGEDLVSKIDNSPASMIRLAVSGGADLDKLEKLLSLQIRYEENEAKKAYNEAMSKFKANPPKIVKDRLVHYETTKGITSYKHATLGNITECISSELSKYGLSAAWTTNQNNNQISVTCKITHSKGHSEETLLCAPADMSGSKNVIQAIGSTITYLERYTLLAMTGLATYDQDDDGVSAGSIVGSQVKTPQSKSEKKAEKAEKAKPAVQETADAGEIVIGVLDVTMKVGKNTAGKEWTQYHIKDTVGGSWNSFEKKVAEEAKLAKEGGYGIAIKIKTKGKYTNIVEAKPAVIHGMEEEPVEDELSALADETFGGSE